MRELARGKRTLIVALAALVVALALGVALGMTQRGDAPTTGCTDAALGGSRAGNAALAADCDALLAARGTLAGGGALNWSAGTPLPEWDGVTVAGAPPRVVGLDLRARGLSGAIPTQLASLTALTSLKLSGNSFTGCIPNVLWSVADKDLPDVKLADCSAAVTLPDDYRADFPRGSGTYRIVERSDAIIFHIPEGAKIRYWDVEYGQCPPYLEPCYPSIILRDENTGSELCLDSVNGEECGRFIVSPDGAGGQNADARIHEIFDRIANSARRDPDIPR